MQKFYTVRAGDSLSKIAARWSIPLNSLIKANNLAAPYVIFPGQQLSMPPGVTTYVVKSGDTLFLISQRYGVAYNLIAEANGIGPPYNIVTGQVLIVPSGVLFYVVRPRDTLYKIAAKYNVVLNGQPRPDLIIKANNGITPNIVSGMTLAIPYPPPGGTGFISVILYDGFNNFIGVYDPNSGSLNSISIDNADSASNLYWSPNKNYIAFVDGSGVISIINVTTKKIINIDQTSLPVFADWSNDSSRVIYSNGSVIRIYNVINNTFKTINRPGALYVQWVPNGTEILYEAKDTSGLSQIFKSNTDGSNEKQITSNTGGPMNNVRLSPNGYYVLFTSPGASISEIYTIELSTGAIFKIPGGPEAKNFFPSWSPDSTKIAYSSTQFINGKYYSQIRVSGIKGEGDTALAISSCYATPVTWSPDSRKIAYLSGCNEENPPVEVWSIDLGKPVPINVLSSFFFYNLDWSLTR